MARTLSINGKVVKLSGISTKISSDDESVTSSITVTCDDTVTLDRTAATYFMDALAIALQTQWRKDKFIPAEESFTWDELVAWTTAPTTRRKLTRAEKLDNAIAKFIKDVKSAGIVPTPEQIALRRAQLEKEIK